MARNALYAAVTWTLIFAAEAAICFLRAENLLAAAFFILPFAALIPLHDAVKSVPRRFAAGAVLGGSIYGLIFLALNLSILRIVRVDLLQLPIEVFSMFGQLYWTVLFPAFAVVAPIVALAGTSKAAKATEAPNKL